jgi:hypothetical protein
MFSSIQVVFEGLHAVIEIIQSYLSTVSASLTLKPPNLEVMCLAHLLRNRETSYSNLCQ